MKVSMKEALLAIYDPEMDITKDQFYKIYEDSDEDFRTAQAVLHAYTIIAKTALKNAGIKLPKRCSKRLIAKMRTLEGML